MSLARVWNSLGSLRYCLDGTTCHSVSGDHTPAMLGDVCALKGRRLSLVFAADVRGAGAFF